MFLPDMTPRQDLLINKTEDIRVAECGNNFVLVYIPYNTKIRLAANFTGWEIKTIDLANRFVAHAAYMVKEGNTIIEMHPFEQDALIILQKK